MNQVAEALVKAEKVLGLDSIICNPMEQSRESLEHSLDSDVHVCHTHIPEWLKRRITKPYKLIWIGHGVPEHCFQGSVEDYKTTSYGANDGWMLMQYWLQNADAIVTFWPRHAAIYQSLCDKKTKVNVLPLGVDKTFWKPTPSNGKFAGSPSLFSAENPHYIKWPLDLFITWPWVYPKIKGDPCLHVAYLAMDMHRWFFPLVNRNGASYGCHITPLIFDNVALRNVFNSVDYFIGLVNKGDHNRLSQEANACGCKTISYRGNPYSDFWLPEGDQREIATELTKILNGHVEPRKKEPVADVMDTATQMKEIYERC